MKQIKRFAKITFRLRVGINEKETLVWTRCGVLRLLFNNRRGLAMQGVILRAY